MKLVHSHIVMIIFSLNFIAMKSVAEGFYKSGATEGKIIKEEAMPMGECIFKILEVQLINKDNNVLDTVK